MVGAIPIALVTYSVGISLSRMFAVKHGYRINSNQVSGCASSSAAFCGEVVY